MADDSNEQRSKEEEFLEKAAELATEYDVEFMLFTKGEKRTVEQEGEEQQAQQIMMASNAGLQLAEAVSRALESILRQAAQEEAKKNSEEALKRFTNQN